MFFSAKFFVEADIKIVNDLEQDICIEYHYTKSTYTYCYLATKNGIIHKYSAYKDFSRNEKINYFK